MQDEFEDLRDDELSELEKALDSIEAQHEIEFSHNCMHEATIKALEDELERADIEHDALLGEYVNLEIRLDSRTAVSIAGEHDRQSELTQLDKGTPQNNNENVRDAG